MFAYPPAPPGAQEQFHGFTLPTTTPIPDQLIDDWLPELSGAELKVVLYICRRTLGFQKISDNISLQQLLSGLVKKNGERLDYGTGLSKTTLLKTLRDLQDKGIITTLHRSSSERGDEATNYRLCFADGVQPLVCQRYESEVTPKEVIGWRQSDFTRGQKTVPGGRSKNCTTRVVQKSRPQQTVVQETDLQETDARSITRGTNNTSGAQSPFGGGVVADETFWSAANQPEEELLLEEESDTHPSSVEQTSPPSSEAPPSPTVERRQTGASALIALGMTTKVAYRLAAHYSLERIEEKLRYLDFLQEHQPDTVKNPCGWLRKAIEDDFAPPDEYRALAEQVQRMTEQEKIEQTQAQSAAALRQQAQAQYETTEAECNLWEQTLTTLDTNGQGYLYDLVMDVAILRVTTDTALIGVADTFQYELLQAPDTQLALSRILTQVAGRPLVPEFVPLRD